MAGKEANVNAADKSKAIESSRRLCIIESDRGLGISLKRIQKELSGCEQQVPASILNFEKKLEIEPRLQFYGSSSESSFRSSELRAIDIRAAVTELKIIQIELIENIKEISSEVQSGAFVHSQKTVEAETLDQADIQ